MVSQKVGKKGKERERRRRLRHNYIQDLLTAKAIDLFLGKRVSLHPLMAKFVCF